MSDVYTQLAEKAAEKYRTDGKGFVVFEQCHLCGRMRWVGTHVGTGVVINESQYLCPRCELIRDNNYILFQWVQDVIAHSKT